MGRRGGAQANRSILRQTAVPQPDSPSQTLRCFPTSPSPSASTADLIKAQPSSSTNWVHVATYCMTLVTFSITFLEARLPQSSQKSAPQNVLVCSLGLLSSMNVCISSFVSPFSLDFF